MANDKYTNGNSQSFEDTINKSHDSLTKLDSKIDGTNRKLGNMASNFDKVGDKMKSAFDKDSKTLIDNMTKTAEKLDKMSAAYKNYVENIKIKGGNIKLPTINTAALNDIKEYGEVLKSLSDTITDLKGNLQGLNVSVDAKGLNAVKNIISKIEKIDTAGLVGKFDTIVEAVNKVNNVDVKINPDSKLALNKIISLLREVRKMTSDDANNLNELNTFLEETFDKVSAIVDKIESSKGLSTMLANQQVKNLNSNLEKELKYKNELINKEKELQDLREKGMSKQAISSAIYKKNGELMYHYAGISKLEKSISGYDTKKSNIESKRDRDIKANPGNASKINAQADYDLAVLAADKEMAVSIKKATIDLVDGINKYKNELLEMAKSGEEVPGLLTKMEENMEALSKINTDTIRAATSNRNSKVGQAAQSHLSLIGSLPNRNDEILARRSATADRTYGNARRRLENKNQNSIINATHASNEVANPLLNDVNRLIFANLNHRLANALRSSETLQNLLSGDSVSKIKARKVKANSDYNIEKANIDLRHDITDKGLTRRENMNSAKLLAQKNKGQISSEDYTTKLQANAERYEKLRAMNQEKKAAKTAKASEVRLAAETAAEKELASVATTTATTISTLAATLAIVAISFAAVTEAAMKAAQADTQIADSLMEMGQSAGTVNTKSISDIQNKLNSIKNKWDQIIVNVGRDFEGMFGGLLGLTDKLLTRVKEATDTMNKVNNVGTPSSSGYNGNTKIASGVVSESVAKGENTEEKAYKTLGDMSTEANNLGLNNNSAVNMGAGIYEQASKIRSQYGGDINEISKDLSDSVFKGGNQAGKYGVDTSEDTLAGYMWSKGIDVVNVKMTEAMKSAYRYQMMKDQASAGNSDAMQDQIQQWKQLGYVIEQTKNQLFSFDKVITLQAVNPTIPNVGKDGTLTDKGPDGTTKKPDQDPGNLGLMEPNIKIKPIIDPQDKQNVEDELKAIPDENVDVNVNVNGEEGVKDLNNELAETETKLAEVNGKQTEMAEHSAELSEAEKNLAKTEDTLNEKLGETAVLSEASGEGMNGLKNEVVETGESAKKSSGFLETLNQKLQQTIKSLNDYIAKSKEAKLAENNTNENVNENVNTNSKLGNIKNGIKTSIKTFTNPLDLIAEFAGSDKDIYQKTGHHDYLAAAGETLEGFLKTPGMLYDTYMANYNYNRAAGRGVIGSSGAGVAGTAGFVVDDVLGDISNLVQGAGNLVTGADNKVFGYRQDSFMSKLGNVFDKQAYELMTDPSKQYKVPGHATGGVTTKEHLANVHPNEVIIPLDNSASKPAFNEIGKSLADNLGGGKGDTFQPIVQAGMIIDSAQAVDHLTDMIEAKLAQRNIRRGGSMYGMQD